MKTITLDTDLIRRDNMIHHLESVNAKQAERIRDLEVTLETVLDTYDNITTYNFSIGLDKDIRNEARKVLQKGQQS